jgi:hypothetical protein
MIPSSIFRKRTQASTQDSAATDATPAWIVVPIDGVELDDAALENVAGGRADWAEDYLTMRYRVDALTF